MTPNEDKQVVEWVGDRTEVDLKLTVGELAVLCDLLNRQETSDRAAMYAIASDLVKPGAGDLARLDFCGMLVRVNTALARAEGMPTAFGSSQAMIDQARARMRDAA